MAAAEWKKLKMDICKPRSVTAGDLIQQINSKNAKLVALFLVFGFICYHGVLHLLYGTDSCKWLLSDGMYKGYEIWQPYGCMMHHYTDLDIKRCFRYIAYWGGKNHFAFVGDSRIRQHYQNLLSQIYPERMDLSTGKMHSNLQYNDTQMRINIEFQWMPMVNDSMIESFRNWQTSKIQPKLVVLGSATWAIKESNASVVALDYYVANLTRLVKVLDNVINKGVRVHWLLQAPVDVEKLTPDKLMITNEQIDLYNKAAMEILQHSQVHVWSSSRLVAQGNIGESPDGIHIGPHALKHDVQIFLNSYCNDYMNFNDGTCCSSSEPITTLQMVTFATLGMFLVLSLSLAVHHCYTKHQSNVANYQKLETNQTLESNSDCRILIKSLAKLAIIMGYFFLCDRTNFFMKENKYFTTLNFWLPIAYIFALGLFFTEDSRYTEVLHRDQTDEWKGWMQMAILIYHMTGASGILPIYMHIRVMVTAYLFLTGYGHFYYFWKRGDAGLVRLFQRKGNIDSWQSYWSSDTCGMREFFKVLFRMNFMTVMLCLCMNRPYQSYYFVPLVSFWFLMVYLLLALPPQITASSTDSNHLHYLYVILKFVVLFSVVIILYMSEVFFEKVFVTRPWKALFVTTDDDIHEWWFRWKLDRYSILYGMAFAFLYLLTKRYNLVADNNHGNLFSPGISLTAVLSSVIGMGIYTTFTFVCHNKPECNEIHPYISFLPIVSYVMLRNISGMLRTRYSSFFAWFGRISLELFIGQYHIWLAADTHGVLVLIPSYPVANVIVTSFIFVCVAHEIHDITGELVNYAVPTDWKRALRNVVCFIIVLIPIGIHDGMF